ncbi:hypothetical protein BH10CYA1_BH10CYA1_11560 [soil metagenome]
MSDWVNRVYFTIAIAGFLFLMPLAASAYIDATTGSYVMQMLFGAFFTALFWIKSLLTRAEYHSRIDYSEIDAELKSTGS